MKTKIQIISDAFNELRINGITTDPDAEDNVLALNRLEDMMHELPALGYCFEDEPDFNTYSGLQAYANYPIAMMLAMRIAPPFGKIPETMMRQASAALSGLMNKIARPSRVAYPSRQPLGMGNRYWDTFYNFFPPSEQAPSNSILVTVGDINPEFTLNFVDSLNLNNGEVISSYSYTVTNGLVISNDSNSDWAVTFEIEYPVAGIASLTMEVIGSFGSKVTKCVYFNVVECNA
jgi:hypothetical protein